MDSTYKVTVRSILAKFGRADRSASESLVTLSFEQLYGKLDTDEQAVVHQLLALKPKQLGFLGPFVAMDGPPKNLVAIEGQSAEIPTQYLPRPASEAFERLAAALNKATGSRLMVESGYRSPAHQALTFLTYLELTDFDLAAVARRVALPGYSQHGDPVSTAVDVVNQEGIPTDQAPQLFAHTREYTWLAENAATFHFYLSYPADNKLGVNYEPWHWQYRKPLMQYNFVDAV